MPTRNSPPRWPASIAGGDIVTGAATVIEAMGAGRKAAASMKANLGLREASAGAERLFGIDRRRAQLRASAHRLSERPMARARTPKMKDAPPQSPLAPSAPGTAGRTRTTLKEHIVEIISDSGEGAQRCGQSLGAIAARMGNGIWTVEIIPAEIRPPARSVAGASGNRIRIGAQQVTNGGDETDLVVAFNEQVLLGRVRAGELKPGCIILLESMWREHADATIAQRYIETHDRLVEAGYRVFEIPMEQSAASDRLGRRAAARTCSRSACCATSTASICSWRASRSRSPSARRTASVIDANIKLLEAGHAWAEANLDFKFSIPAERAREPQIVVNGNTALALGVLASGMEICAMYPITPATSASHYLSDVFEKVGGMVHQAEDEIAACAFAIGASYAGKCTVTITSGPGYSLKQEAIGLAVMGEIPLVVVNVQRGGPSTGQPTKIEQGDLMTAIFGSHGDAPKVVMAPATIEDCFYSMITARKIAETFNMVVVVLTDASLATSQQPFPRPQFSETWMAPPIDQSAVPEGRKPYDWDATTGSRAALHSRPAGRHAHADRTRARPRQPRRLRPGDQRGKHAHFRSLKLAALQKTLKTPPVFGDAEGDLLVVGWGSTKGAIEEAVAGTARRGHKVSSLHL